MKIPKLNTKHLLSVADLSREEILNLFKLAGKLKYCLRANRSHRILSGKTLAMIFEKHSTRTRISFETGIFQLGGQAIFLGTNDMQLGRGETIADTARVLSRYVDAIMIRTFEQSMVEELARHADIPVINGLTDYLHPCQALTDFFTIYEKTKNLNTVKLMYIGDGNNVANSLILTAAILGASIAVACPAEYNPDKKVVEKAIKFAEKSGATILITTDIDKAAKDADFIYTDVWVSMGQDAEKKQRLKILKNYRISREILDKCSVNCLVMHDLPAHRGEEIDADVMDSERSIIFDQAENRLHMQKALMCALMSK